MLSPVTSTLAGLTGSNNQLNQLAQLAQSQLAQSQLAQLAALQQAQTTAPALPPTPQPTVIPTVNAFEGVPIFLVPNAAATNLQLLQKAALVRIYEP